MNKKLTIILASSLFFSTLSCSIFAASAKPSGVYFEGNLGYGKTNGFSYYSDHNTGLIGSINAGYKFNKNFATEIGVTRFPNVEMTSRAHYYLDLALKPIFPISDSFNLFAKIGPAVAHSSKDDHDDFGPATLIGIGAEYAFTQNFSLVLQGSSTTTYNKKVPSNCGATLGIQFII